MTMPGDLPVRSTGIEQYIAGSRLKSANERFDEAIRVAALGGDHVWVALVHHHIQDPAVYGRDGEGHLDAETIVGAYIGCYACEEPYTERLARRRCPGKPSG